MIQILIADDHNLMINGILSALGDVQDFKIVGKANNGIEALNILENSKVDVILMDIVMPLMDGLDCTKVVAEKYPNTKVIALSQFGENRFVKKMIKNGASGYLLKDATKEELIEAIKKVINGETYFSKNLKLNHIEIVDKADSKYSLMPRFTKREIEVLNLLSHEYSSPEIADKLSISSNTVERHRANMIEKAGLKNTAGLIKWALENKVIE